VAARRCRQHHAFRRLPRRRGRSDVALSLDRHDAEPDEPLPRGVLDDIALPLERERLGARDGPPPDRLLFSAKETVYKAWFPLARRWLGFDDVVVTLHPNQTLTSTCWPSDHSVMSKGAG
jgi:4'-phosphopantetheinyl transferase EntD